MASETAPRADLDTGSLPSLSQSIKLVSHPKILLLYPSVIAAILAGIYMLVRGGDAAARPDTYVLSFVFLVFFAANMIVLSFDFPRGTSLTLFFFLLALGLGVWLLIYFNQGFAPAVADVLRSVRPFANATFYFLFAGLMSLIYVAVFISVRFDYWEVRPNELLHHHGMLSDLERLPAPNLRIDKEINDVFEYILLRSGRLILHPSNERRAIVLENVVGINRKEEEIARMLGTLQVQVRA